MSSCFSNSASHLSLVYSSLGLPLIYFPLIWCSSYLVFNVKSDIIGRRNQGWMVMSDMLLFTEQLLLIKSDCSRVICQELLEETDWSKVTWNMELFQTLSSYLLLLLTHLSTAYYWVQSFFAISTTDTVFNNLYFLQYTLSYLYLVCSKPDNGTIPVNNIFLVFILLTQC